MGYSLRLVWCAAYVGNQQKHSSGDRIQTYLVPSRIALLPEHNWIIPCSEIEKYAVSSDHLTT